MASIEESIYSLLVNDGAVTAIVGTRVRPGYLPEGGALPAISYDRISTPRVRSLSGLSGLAHPRFQITMWAATYSAVKSLAVAVKAALADKTGTVAAVYIGHADLDDEGDMLTITPGVESLDRYGVRQDYEIWHEE